MLYRVDLVLAGLLASVAFGGVLLLPVLAIAGILAATGVPL